MTFENVVDAYEFHLQRLGRDPATARAVLNDWLTETADNAALSSDVRIVLVSANFDTEITTTVLWLNSFDRMDIRCVRLVPYLLDERLVVDVQQIIPLPEAADYQVRIRDKELEVRSIQSRANDGRDWTSYVVTTPTGASGPLRKRRAVLYMVHALHQAGVSCRQIATVLPLKLFTSVEGELTGDLLTVAFKRAYPGIDSGWRFLGDDEILPQDDATWVLSKRWNRYGVEDALTALAALAPSRSFSFNAQTTGPAGTTDDTA